MTKDVQETSAYRSLGAWIILNPKGEYIGKVLAHYANSGGVTVNVLQWGDERAAVNAVAMGYTLDDAGKIATFNGKATRHEGEWPYAVANRQSGHAGGYGYDKFTAALSGLYIDGHRTTNHCEALAGEAPKRPKGRLWKDSDKARLLKKGYRLANWSQGVEPGELDRYGKPEEVPTFGREGVPQTESGYVSCYRFEGLGFIETQGYRVIKAV